MSEAIFAWGGSSSLGSGRKSWFKQDSKRDIMAGACCSIVPVSLKLFQNQKQNF